MPYRPMSYDPWYNPWKISHRKYEDPQSPSTKWQQDQAGTTKV